MKVRINFTVGNTEDSVILCGDSVEEIREKADRVVRMRNGVNPWSEELIGGEL